VPWRATCGGEVPTRGRPAHDNSIEAAGHTAGGTITGTGEPGLLPVRAGCVGLTHGTGRSYTVTGRREWARPGHSEHSAKTRKQLRPYCDSVRPIGTPDALSSPDETIRAFPQARSTYPPIPSPGSSTKASSFPRLLASSFPAVDGRAAKLNIAVGRVKITVATNETAGVEGTRRSVPAGLDRLCFSVLASSLRS
jgi:hypothetical protein